MSNVEQPKTWELRGKGIVTLIVLLAMAPPVASDMYMPGLPILAADLNTTQALTSNTLTAFFLFMAIGSLFIGALSDKYGRKPILLASIGLTLVSSLLCAVVSNIGVLLALRAVHGFGSGGMIAMATALSKDYFSGIQMARIIGFTQAAAMIAPVVAPVIGVAVLTVAGWRAVFVAIAVCSLCTFILALFLREPVTRDKRSEASIRGVFSTMKGLLGQFDFMSYLAVGALAAGPFMAYLGLASFVYEEYFGFTEVQFSMAFGATAVVSLIGPLGYPRFTKRFSADTLVGFLLFSSVGCTIVMVLFGQTSAVVFLIVMMVYGFLATTARPMVTSFLLASLSDGIGAASSLINFVLSGTGCIAIIIGSAGWDPVVLGMQVSMALFLTLGVIVFVIRLRSLAKRR